MGGKIVRGAGDLEQHGDPAADELAGLGDDECVVGAEGLELRALLEPVAGNVGLHLLDHGLDGPLDRAVIHVAVDQAVDGVAHHDRRIAGIEDHQGSPALCSADGLQVPPRWFR